MEFNGHCRLIFYRKAFPGFVVSKIKKIQRLSIFLLPIFKDFSKTFKSNQLSKNCKVSTANIFT